MAHARAFSDSTRHADSDGFDVKPCLCIPPATTTTNTNDESANPSNQSNQCVAIVVSRTGGTRIRHSRRCEDDWLVSARRVSARVVEQYEHNRNERGDDGRGEYRQRPK